MILRKIGFRYKKVNHKCYVYEQLKIDIELVKIKLKIITGKQIICKKRCK